MKRVFAIFLTCVFLLGLLPTSALAAEADGGGLCPHHQEHSYETCGYIEAVEGQLCGHVHDGNCGYVETAEEVPCDMDCADTDEDGQIIHTEGCAYAPAVEGAPCQHEHDGECGYVEALEGQPCGYVCRICTVQTMIDALPDAEGITPDNRADVEAQLDAISEAWVELTDEEAEQLDTAHCEAAISALLALDGQDGANEPMPLADGDVSYRFCNENGQNWQTGTKSSSDYTLVTASANAATTNTWNAGWYVVSGDVTIGSRAWDQPKSVIISGDVHLILTDNCSLIINGSMVVSSGNSITIYAQSTKPETMGKLSVRTHGYARYDVAIGNDRNNTGCGNIVINGGDITATAQGSGSGIGGKDGTITINGGKVTAKGHGKRSTYGSAWDHWCGAGIGGSGEYTGAAVKINGGQVTAIGGQESKDWDVWTAPGIGGGISHSSSGESGTFSISGNAVLFTNAISDQSDKENWHGVVFEGTSGAVYGNVSLSEDLTIPSGYTLTIPDGVTLTIPSGVTLTVDGIITGGGTISSSGTITCKTPDSGKGYTLSYADETATAQNGYEVSADNSAWANTVSVTPGGTLHVRKAGCGVTSQGAENTISARPSAPTLTIDNAAESVTISSEYYYNATGPDYTNTWTQGIGSAVTVAPEGSIYIYKASTSSTFKSAVQTLTAPVRSAAPTAPLEVTKTANSITITNTSSYPGCEFSKDGTSWSDSGAFTGLTAGTTYTIQVRVKATASSFKSTSMTQAVTTVAGDGSTTVKPGESAETGGATITNDGEKIIITGGDGTTTTITPPTTGGDVNVEAGGGVTVPSGSTVQTGDNGPEITVGDKGGIVGGDGSIIVPDGGTIQIGTDPATTITPPNGEAVTPNEDDTVDVPGGSTVQTGGNGPEITVGDKGGTVSGDGSVTVPGGGNITVKGSPDNTTITLPSGGGTVKPNPDGTVTVPGGSTVETGNGDPVTIPDGGGVFNPDTGEIELNVHTVTVNGGTGGGSYAEGATVTITATAPSGQRFTSWTVNAGGVTLTNASSATTTFTMPAQAVTVTANFENIPAPTFLVTVNGGTGGGSYTEGAAVTITATVPSGQRFTGWTVNTGGVTLADASSATTTFTMPAQAVTVTANFQSNSGGGNSSGGGGGSYTPPTTTYPPTVERPSEGGSAAAVSPSNPKRGDTVTVTPKPDQGYEVDKITVTDQNGKPVEITVKPDGTYTFTQPTGKVKIEITYKPVQSVETPWNNPFTDVSEGDWYYEAVRFVQERGLMNGYSDRRFGPNDPLSRAQLAQILFNKEGRPVVNYLMGFSDVAGEAWYAEAIRWATSQGIVGGYGNGRFGPNDPITREQLAVMLWRYSGSPAATNKELHFNDTDEISGFALEALRWAVENGILNGYGDGQLGPKGQATRAQVAQMLKNFIENQEANT